jgi:hypothetical protein
VAEFGKLEEMREITRSIMEVEFLGLRLNRGEN